MGLEVFDCNWLRRLHYGNLVRKAVLVGCSYRLRLCSQSPVANDMMSNMTKKYTSTSCCTFAGIWGSLVKGRRWVEEDVPILAVFLECFLQSSSRRRSNSWPGRQRPRWSRSYERYSRRRREEGIVWDRHGGLVDRSWGVW